MYKVSYAITVKDEIESFIKLINLLEKKITTVDEIVILHDSKNGSSDIIEFLKNYNSSKSIKYFSEPFNNNFADWKNKLTSYCSNDYIFQIDADELPNELLLDNLQEILVENDIDVYLIPRINIVEGITQEHISKWNWKINSKGWINFPDYQWRLYKNVPNIKWKNKVHEALTGFTTFTTLPSYEELCLYHLKSISRQEGQNSFYQNI